MKKYGWPKINSFMFETIRDICASSMLSYLFLANNVQIHSRMTIFVSVWQPKGPRMFGTIGKFILIGVRPSPNSSVILGPHIRH